MSGAKLDVAVLYDRHADFVWRLLTRLGVPPAAAEDAVQEVFLIVHRRRGDFRQTSQVRTWIGGIAVRVARDHRRARARHQARLAVASEPVASVRGPDELVSAAQALARVLRLLQELDDDQRVVFVLTELEELTAQEIAEMTGTSINTVSSRLRLARTRFNALVSAHRHAEEQV